MGYRGSSSSSASAYKKSGHRVEDLFADSIGGSTDDLPPQGKTDVVGPDGKTYSVKSESIHWQIFLYGLTRLSTDENFIELAASGLDLSGSLRCFPKDSAKYFTEKASLKARLPHLKRLHSGDPDALTEALRREFPGNTYLSSKISLQEHNLQMLKFLRDDKIKSDFLKLALFNGDEVEYLAIQSGGRFHIFPAAAVVKCLVDNTTAEVSGTGGQFGDLSIGGQKLLLRTDKNLMELEVRNEPAHYRELRMNFASAVCFQLLSTCCSEVPKTAVQNAPTLKLVNPHPTPKDVFDKFPRL